MESPNHVVPYPQQSPIALSKDKQILMCQSPKQLDFWILGKGKSMM